MLPLHPDETLLRWARFHQETHRHSIDLFAATTEKEFADAVEATLHIAIDKMESRKKREWADYSETQLRDILLFAIEGCEVDATAEEDTNGHVDFTVKHRHRGTFRYLGECKVWDGYEYHCKGVGQLLKRYASGRHARTCCLEFVPVADMVGKFSDLRKNLDAKRPLKQKAVATNHAHIKGAFVTCHAHKSGFEVEVLHLGCNVHVEEDAP